MPEPIEVPVEPVLSAERAEALRQHLEVTQIKRGTKGVHPLSGRLFCLCGQPMTGIARSDRANRRYRCRHGRNTPGRPFCAHPSLLGDEVDRVVWAEVIRLLTQPTLLLALAEERLGLLEGAQVVTADALAQAQQAVDRTRTAVAKAAARCIALDLDEATAAATLAELQAQHKAALQHERMIASVSADTLAARQRMVTAQELASVAAETLAYADRDLQAKVFGLLDVRVTVLEQRERLFLRVEGSVAHDLLLDEVRGGLAPAVQASARA